MSIDNPFAYETLAFDKGSVRSVDENGFLHVKISPLTRVQVAPYYGKEIPGWRGLGLDPDKIYKGYRPESELKKATTIESINGIPIQLRHHPDFAEDPAKDTRIGATGTDGKYASPYLMNSLHFFDKKARDLIESEALRELSLAYRYKPDFTPGKTEDGQEYDFIMRDISGNHLALVEQGRAGHEVLVYDSKRSDMEKDEITNLVNDALDKKLSSILNAFGTLAERVNKYIEKNSEAEKVEETEEAEEVISDKCAADKCGGKKTAKDKKPVKQVDEEGEEVEEVIDLSDKSKDLPDTKPENKKKAEKVETEAEEVEDFEESEAEEETAEELEKKGIRKVSEDEEEAEIEVTEKETKKKAESGEKDGKFMETVKKYMKKGGIDEDAPDDIKESFINGLRVAGVFNKNLMAQDEAAEVYSLEDVNNAYEVARNDVMAELEAIEAVKPVMGNVKIGAFDSADDVYKAACDELDITCDSANARTAYEAYMKAQRKNLHNSGASPKATEVKSDVLSDILNNVNVD